MSAAACNPGIIVPVYNHGAQFRAVLPVLAAYNLPIIVVDDGSPDHCARALKVLCDSVPGMTLLTHPHNRGKGAAVMTAIRAAATMQLSHVLQIDADGQHASADIGRFLDAARRHPEAVVLGVPEFGADMPRGRRVGRFLTHVCVWMETLSLEIRDSMCGFRVYPLARVLPLIKLHTLGQRMDFDPEILVRLHWAGTRFIGIPTRVTYPQDGSSNFNLLRDNMLITRMHTRLLLGMLVRLPRLVAGRLKIRGAQG